MRKLVLLSLLGAAAACAQGISVGVLGGAPFNDVVKATNGGGAQIVATSTNFVIGPALRVNLPASLRFELDALYRPASFRLSLPGSVSNVSANQWRFPVLLQYRFGTPVVKPFIEGGLSYEHRSGVSDSAVGIVLGAGVDVKIPLVRLSGELRYTRDTYSGFSDISNPNQAEVLFGVHF